MAEAYSDFASVYDELMDATPYETWLERIVSLIREYGVSKPRSGPAGDAASKEELLASERDLVVDLGCGTGTLSEMLYQEGYDVIGVDNSEAMLAKAMEKREESGSEFLYLLQDLR